MKIGKIKNIRRYPVKSMAGEELPEVYISYSGLIGDRVYAFIDKTNTSNFPWMTARQKAEMLLYKPKFTYSGHNASTSNTDANLLADFVYPDKNSYELEVTTPTSEKYNIESTELLKYLEEKFGRKLRLKFSEKGMKDSRPVSLVGMSSVEALAKEMGIQIDPIRFRMNLYVEWDSPQTFYEQELIGKNIQIGDNVVLHIQKPDKRCVIITLDPQTGQAKPEILQTLAEKHDNCFGVYCVVMKEGVVKNEDTILIL